MLVQERCSMQENVRRKRQREQEGDRGHAGENKIVVCLCVENAFFVEIIKQQLMKQTHTHPHTHL